MKKSEIWALVAQDPHAFAQYYAQILKDQQIGLKVIKSSTDAFNFFLPILFGLEQEQSVVMALNRANNILDHKIISLGGIYATIVDPKVVFSFLLKTPKCCAFIIAHNHPSGNTQPSETDRKLASNLKTGGEILQLKPLDFMIVTDHGYFSFADEGLI